MKGLILKDFINLKKNIKIMGVLTLIYGFMAFTQADSNFFASVFTMLFAILLLSTYSYDELSKWEGYALTMPFKRESIVQGKYITMLLLTLIGAGFSMVFSIVLNIILKKPNMFRGIEVCAAGAAIVILFYSIVIPFITKLGVEKARYILFAVYLIPFIAVYTVNSQLKGSSMKLPDTLLQLGKILMENVYIVVPLLLIIALGISYKISINIYNKKEF